MTRDDPFLSIVIPTYNRSEKLERQLAWLHDELAAVDVSYEVRIHDNCSPDATPEVCARWAEAFDRFEVVRNPENIGLQRNLALALGAGSGVWTWAISDDDRIHDGGLARVVELLQEQSDLALLYLNHRGLDASGAIVTEQYFDESATGRLDDGLGAFTFHVTRDMGCVMLMTATVFRTTLVHDALAAWRGSTRNWAIFGFLTGYTAAHGPIFITPEIELDCLEGESSWHGEAYTWTRAIYEEIPSTFLQLSRQGYPAPICRELGLRGLEPIHWWSVRSHLRALRHSPQCVWTLLRVAALDWNTTPRRPAVADRGGGVTVG